MIRRFICLLLVSSLLCNQGVSLAHAHHGTEFSAQTAHASRPHFHFSGHAHHHIIDVASDQAGHSHEHHTSSDHASDDHAMKLPLTLAPVADHDADAVYFAGPVALTRDSNSPILAVAEQFLVATTPRMGEGLLRRGAFWYSPPEFDAPCPIYLRTLSLRI